MSDINLLNNIKQQESRIKSLEQLGGRGLNMPSNFTTSGSRKLLHSVQYSQVILPLNPEKPILCTGFESQFGQMSSAFIKNESDKIVLAKITRFPFLSASNLWLDNYFLIVQDINTKECDVIERKPCDHSTESYGYLYDNTYIDSLTPNSIIKNDATIIKSNGFDKDDNRKDGINLNVTYLSSEDVKEDGIRISRSAAEKLSSPLVKKFSKVINENDIPLNLYGNNQVYKIIPDIGEKIQNGYVMALRTERKDESLFSQSIDRLQTLMMSDDTITQNGIIGNIKIQCNNPELLETSPYMKQLKYYYDYEMKFNEQIVNIVGPLMKNFKCTPKLNQLYNTCKRTLEGVKFIDDRPFSFLRIEFTVLDKNTAKEGDKVTNRYAGKGVISNIVDDELMPRIVVNGEEVVADLVYCAASPINRENIGQNFEVSINYINHYIVSEWNRDIYELNEYMNMLYTFLDIVCPAYGKEVRAYYESVDDIYKKQIIDDIKQTGYIFMSQLPMTETMTIDKIAELYDAFPFVKRAKTFIFQKGSTGRYRKIESYRPLVIGKEYIYRLEQVAEAKFSAVPLSATNISGENSRSNSKKQNNSVFSTTPVKILGEMETGDLAHVGVELTVLALMLHSASPVARRLCEQITTGDPFNVSIDLTSECTNRKVEKLNVYLKTMGYKLVFIKRKKKKKAIMMKRIMYKPYKLQIMHKCKNYESEVLPKEQIERTLVDYSKQKPLQKIMVKNPYFRKR